MSGNRGTTDAGKNVKFAKTGPVFVSPKSRYCHSESSENEEDLHIDVSNNKDKPGNGKHCVLNLIIDVFDVLLIALIF